MTYEEVIDLLQSGNGVAKNSETGELFQLGDDIPEWALKNIVRAFREVRFALIASYNI